MADEDNRNNIDSRILHIIDKKAQEYYDDEIETSDRINGGLDL